MLRLLKESIYKQTINHKNIYQEEGAFLFVVHLVLLATKNVILGTLCFFQNVEAINFISRTQILY